MVATGAMVVLVGIICFVNQGGPAWKVTIATGAEGLTFDSLGEQLRWSLTELHGNPIEDAPTLRTSGSAANLSRLLTAPEQDHTIAFASKAALQQRLNADPSAARQIRVIATLYQDLLQVVVKTNIHSLGDLVGRRVFLGEPGTTTETIASNILSSLKVDCEVTNRESEADAAFYLAGSPALRVAEALAGGSRRLLDLASEIGRIEPVSGLTQRTIPPFTYKGQAQAVQTLQDDVYLLCNTSLPKALARLIVKTLFDDIATVQKAQRIRLDDALQTARHPLNVTLHPGVEAFREAESEMLYVAAAGLNDNYWEYGVAIGRLLEQRGIPCRVIPTEGSIQNLRLLSAGEQPVLAILQYDVALAAHTGDARFVCDLTEPPSRAIPVKVPGMRRIARLQEERLHVIQRVDPRQAWTPGEPPSATNWQRLVVCSGPGDSGTKVVADTVLRLSRYQPLTTTELPVDVMVERVFDGSVDVAFFMGKVPNPGLQALLGSGVVRLLRVDSRVVARLSGQVFQRAFVDESAYLPSGSATVDAEMSSQPSGQAPGPGQVNATQHPPVETIATHAALITTENLPFDVYKITKCLFDNAEILGLSTNEMASDLAIPLHPDALAYYRQVELPGYTRPPTLVQSLGDQWWDTFHAIQTVLTRWGIRAATAEATAGGLAILMAVLLGILVNFATKHVILAGLTAVWNHAETKWDALFIDRKVLNLLAYLVAAVVIYAMALVAMARNDGSGLLERLVTSGVLIYMLVIGVLIASCLLNGALAIYRTFPVSQEIPLKGVVQLIKIAVYGMASILVVAIIFERSPIYLLSGLGALTAVGMLVFKDSLQGFVAGLQLSGNKLLATGDWIAMPRHGLDGEVLDVSLTMVKVQNFDKTIVTVPTQALTSDSFRNWRGMRESGGRRFKRAVHIDINSIKICDEDLLDRLSRIRLLADHIESKRQEIKAQNEAHGIEPSNLVDGRRQTNIGLFRAYLVSYLRKHPKVRQDMTLLVRQLHPGEAGLPIEICAFITEQAWVDFETVQADIFDHVLAIVPRFDLKVFQGPAGVDFRSLAGMSLRSFPQTNEPT